MINIFKNTLKVSLTSPVSKPSSAYQAHRQTWPFKCIAKSKTDISDEVTQTWQGLIDIKNHITAQLDSENDG